MHSWWNLICDEFIAWKTTNLSWKEIQILDTPIVLLMADTGRNVFTLLFKMRGRLKVMSSSSLISLITTRICSANLRKETSLLMSLEQMIYPQVSTKESNLLTAAYTEE
jgi:hypothetical protein